jgi:hypothetical protein
VSSRIPIRHSGYICSSGVSWLSKYLYSPKSDTYSLPKFLSVPPPSQHRLALASALAPPTSRTTKEKDHSPSPLASSSPQPPSAPQHPDAPLSAPAPSTGSESRRRNAEQRAAQLRADPLLAQVEPHRVFCALCRKWVQLRQDSTFCAYPWQQHRSKCVVRQSVTSILFFFIYSYHRSLIVLSLRSEKKIKVKAVGSATHSGCATPASGDESSDYYELDAEGDDMDTAEDADAALDADSTDNHAPRYADLGSPADRYVFTLSPFHSKAMTDRAHLLVSLINPIVIAGTTKIDSYLMILVIDIAIWDRSRVVALLLLHLCRLNFTRHSITYLFRTTYTPSDALTIAALVAYMNAAFPPDKHEEFDTAEVTRAAKTLHDRGNVAFEGDTLKLLH